MSDRNGRKEEIKAILQADKCGSSLKEEMPESVLRFSSQQIRLVKQILHRAAAFGKSRKSGIEHKGYIKSWLDTASKVSPRLSCQPFCPISRNGAGKRTHRNKCRPSFPRFGPKHLYPHSPARKSDSILKYEIDFPRFPYT